MASRQAYQEMFGSIVKSKPKSRLRSAGVLLFHIAQNITLTMDKYLKKLRTVHTISDTYEIVLLSSTLRHAVRP
jgi:hypothetical protein